MVAVAGVDLALGGTGIARPGGTTRRVRAPGRLSGYERHWHIASEVLHDAAEADLVVIEGYALHAFPKALVAASELGGIIRAALTRAGIAFADVNPNTLKVFATGNGRADKDAMLEAAQAHSDHPINTHDAADAYFLRLMGLARHGYDVGPLESSADDALDRVDWPDVQ